ncbi:MAG: hypothetical protein ABJO88_00050 [Parasphingorhabdus sp.]
MIDPGRCEAFGIHVDDDGDLKQCPIPAMTIVAIPSSSDADIDPR